MARTGGSGRGSVSGSGHATANAPGNAPGNGSNEPDVEPEPAFEVTVSVSASVSGHGLETDSNVAASASMTGPAACGCCPGVSSSAAAAAPGPASTSGYVARLAMQLRLCPGRQGRDLTVTGPGAVNASSDEAPAAAAADPSPGNSTHQGHGRAPLGRSAGAAAGPGRGPKRDPRPTLGPGGLWVWDSPTSDHAPASSSAGSASKPRPQAGHGAQRASHERASHEHASHEHASMVEVYCTSANWTAQAGKYHKTFDCKWLHDKRKSYTVCVSEAEARANNMARCSCCWP
jgi:hypothetical protein